MSAPLAGDVDLESLVPHVFREHYSDWTGRAWLEIDGRSPVRLPIGEGYGALRKALRARFPDNPWQSDWQAGLFPVAPFGLPAAPFLLAAIAVWMGAFALVLLTVGGRLAALVALAGLWPVARSLDGVEISKDGLRAGPLWAERVPWHRVRRVGLWRSGRSARLWVLHDRGASSGSVPLVLLPAVRAALSRRGALPLEEGGDDIDLRYAIWKPAADGIPWGVLVGTAVASPMLERPFEGLLVGGVVALGLAMLGASVHARSTGWGTGAVGWLVLLEALLFTLFSLGWW